MRAMLLSFNSNVMNLKKLLKFREEQLLLGISENTIILKKEEHHRSYEQYSCLFFQFSIKNPKSETQWVS